MWENACSLLVALVCSPEDMSSSYSAVRFMLCPTPQDTLPGSPTALLDHLMDAGCCIAMNLRLGAAIDLPPMLSQEAKSLCTTIQIGLEPFAGELQGQVAEQVHHLAASAASAAVPGLLP